MTQAIFEILGQVLKLGVLTMEEKHRYEDNLLKLRKEWYEEYEKLETDQGSDNRLDDIELELRLLNTAIVEALRAKNA